MSYLEEILPEFRKGAKIRRKCWESTFYIEPHDSEIKTSKGNILYFGLDYLRDDDWELYQEPIDWDYVIENKCLCWFWDDEFESKTDIKTFGLLKHYNPDAEEPFCMKFGGYWKNCRPVRRDEVTFYEDKDK